MSEQHYRLAQHSYRILVWIIVAVAILVVVTRPFPSFPKTEQPPIGSSADTYLQEVSEAASRFARNERTADSAPKQQVLNGWLSNDLLTIMARENAEAVERLRAIQQLQKAAADADRERWEWQMRDRRVESMVAILGLGAASHLLGSSVIGLLGARRRQQPAAPAQVSPPAGPGYPSTPAQSAPQTQQLQPPQPPRQWPTQPPSGFTL